MLLPKKHAGAARTARPGGKQLGSVAALSSAHGQQGRAKMQRKLTSTAYSNCANRYQIKTN